MKSIAYFRITCDTFERDSIITINEKIKPILEASYNNLLLSATNEDGSLYIGTNGEIGYDINKRFSASSGTIVDVPEGGMCISGYIPYKLGQKIRIKNMRLKGSL